MDFTRPSSKWNSPTESTWKLCLLREWPFKHYLPSRTWPSQRFYPSRPQQKPSSLPPLSQLGCLPFQDNLPSKTIVLIQSGLSNGGPEQQMCRAEFSLVFQDYLLSKLSHQLKVLSPRRHEQCICRVSSPVPLMKTNFLVQILLAQRSISQKTWTMIVHISLPQQLWIALSEPYSEYIYHIDSGDLSNEYSFFHSFSDKWPF